MQSIKKSLSINMIGLKGSRNELNAKSNPYPQTSPLYKLADYGYKTEIQQFIKDIEDITKTDAEVWQKYKNQVYTEEFKLKLRDTKIGQNDYSILHLAAKNCRKNFCIFLIKEIKIDKDIKCKSKSTPLQLLIRTNILFKQEFISKNLVYELKKNAFIETFDALVEFKADPNYQDESGYSCLHYAISKNNFGAAYKLVNTAGININLEDKKNLTPLHLACKFGYEEEAELLIEKIDTDKLFNLCIAEHSLSILPLHLACRNKTEKFLIVFKILDKFRQIDDKKKFKNIIDLVSIKEDFYRQTILNISIENNHLKIVDLLLGDYKFNADISDSQSGNLPIHITAKNGSIEMLHLLIKHNAVSFRTNNNQENALHIAATNNKYKFIREFLTYEKVYITQNTDSSLLIKKSSQDPDYIPCACYCDEIDFSNYELSIKQRDKNYYTPLMRAIASGNQKCVDELINDNYVELDCRDKDGQSIFHICTLFNNVETLKHLFQLESITNDLLYSKDNFENTILHTCCKIGNLEIVKLIVNKINDGNNSIEQILYAKNHDGQTCFQLACVKGYFNLVEYFLKDRKLNQFLEHVDNNSNTSLHLATENGHAGIVSLLLDYGADVISKNEENITPLDLSCRLGYFEISKNIINNCADLNHNEKINELPLHTACYEGAYEVVKLLLLKGVRIDQLNEQNKNCLEIAIQQGQREVIRVLLEDPNWHKLIRLNNRVGLDENLDELNEEDNEDESYEGKYLRILVDDLRKTKKTSEKKIVENPELMALFDNKMWDIFKILLDKCVSEKEIDFTKIDPPVRSVSRHPLMLIALSGQENLLKHETTRTLLDLKWRVIPRCAFYFNLFIYMLFMLLFSLYTIELSKMGNEMYMSINSENISSNLSNRDLKMQLFKEKNFYETSNFVIDSKLYIFLILLLVFQLIKEMFQIFFLDGLTYFLSLQNLIELFTYITSMLSLFSSNYNSQSSHASIAVLFAFIVFPLFTQKLKIFGLYVVAFRRTLANSAKFFPIFLIIFTGFILSFRIRSNFDVSYFNSTSYSIIRTLTMVVGELDTAKMGLYNGSLPNYIIYFMFIGLMCTIVLNLFVGIAVGEIKTVLDEADIQQTSMRIIFVLKVQSALYFFQKTCLGNCLNMQFSRYSLHDSSNTFWIIKNKIWENAKDMLYSKEHTIKLSDPQKRLEDSFNEMSRTTSDHIKSIRFGFSNQITDCESRLSNSQRRLQDTIVELGNKTDEQIRELRNDNLASVTRLNEKLADTQNRFEILLEKLANFTNDEFKQINNTFNTQMCESETKIINLNNRIQSILMNLNKQTAFQFESLKEFSQLHTQSIKMTVINNQKLIDESILELNKSNKMCMEIIESKYLQRIESIEAKLDLNEAKLVCLIESLFEKLFEKYKKTIQHT